MKKSLLAAALVSCWACVGISGAQAVTFATYGSPGTPNPIVYSFTATATGDVIGYFVGFSASSTDQIAMSVNGGPLGPFGLVNQTSTIGSSFNFGSVNVGDTLTFVLRNVTNSTDISSDPAANPGGVQYIFSAPFVANDGVPTGILVSFEDLLASQGSDFDYNDDSFVFTNVSTAETPIPAALPLFVSGLVMVGLLARRRKRKAVLAA